ncbi:MAG: hypothetical protein FJ280_15280 [Planctomycetes bacterium]|nr:hypothetical protein [Planctomycetota bacterium]
MSPTAAAPSRKTPFQRDLERQRSAAVDTQTAGTATGKSTFDEATNRELTDRLLGRKPATPAAVQPPRPAADIDVEALARQNAKLAADVRTAEDHLLATRSSDEQLRAHFAATPGLRDEFSGPEAFLAYMRHLPPLA